jgi:hypothetical protein
MHATFAEFAGTALRLAAWLVLLTALFVPLERWFGAPHAPRPRRERLHAQAALMIIRVVAIVRRGAPRAPGAAPPPPPPGRAPPARGPRR